MRKKILALLFPVVAVIAMAAFALHADSKVELKRGVASPTDRSPKIAVAYVESFRKDMPDPDLFTHLIYAFAEFNDDCDALVLPTPERLKEIARLRSLNPGLKVILGVGGYKREGFSEMAGDKKKRKSFVKSVKSIVDSLGLDGVDLDWEFPTTEAGGHTASPDDDKNYVTLVKDLRKKLGRKKWISFYSNNSANFIDLKGMVPYVDYVNVSGYNLSIPKDGERAYHQSPLYSGTATGAWCVKKSIERHIGRGVPPEKILMGIPFFGRGKAPFPSYLERNTFGKYADGVHIVWDDEAEAPYYADKDGNLVMGYDDERSINAKFDFIRTNCLPGIFVWNYDADYPDHRLAKTIEKLRK